MAKKYQVLARKYRPQAFRDVVGQEAAVTTLKNAIRFDKVAHAYLFCGSRGVGKTTLARLFAKALNCQSPTADLEPCNQCPSCLEVVSGQSLDVIEIDGASNRGIDDIRQINETVGYAPSHGKYKIYIIDEVHMLTKEAFNALLKTLEEPPERAKFFFATTEPHKVLPTIISRCQRFDLARIQPILIANKLQQIATDLSRDVDPEALQLIAAFAEGSLRDAESLFDQILCFSEHKITAAIVRSSLGLVPAELFHNLDQAFSEHRLAYAFELVDQLFQTGKDLPHFLEQLIEHYRNLTLARTLNTPHPSARAYTQAQALHILDLLIQAETSFQKSPFQRIALESILLQIIRSRHRIPIEVLIRKLTENPAELPKISLEEPAPEPAPVIVVEPTPAPVIVAEPPPPQIEVIPPAPQALKPVPFNPYNSKEAAEPLPVVEKIVIPVAPEPVAIVEKKVTPPTPVAPKSPPPSSNVASKHPSHYDTLMRFAAVELEGTIKK
jgi:DNA polymerase-3 subunit gamma/tau